MCDIRSMHTATTDTTPHITHATTSTNKHAHMQCAQHDAAHSTACIDLLATPTTVHIDSPTHVHHVACIKRAICACLCMKNPHTFDASSRTQHVACLESKTAERRVQCQVPFFSCHPPHISSHTIASSHQQCIAQMEACDAQAAHCNSKTATTDMQVPCDTLITSTLDASSCHSACMHAVLVLCDVTPSWEHPSHVTCLVTCMSCACACAEVQVGSAIALFFRSSRRRHVEGHSTKYPYEHLICIASHTHTHTHTHTHMYTDTHHSCSTFCEAATSSLARMGAMQYAT